VASILERVRHEGDEALFDLTQRFDGVRPDPLAIPPERLAQAWEATAPSLRLIQQEAERQRQPQKGGNRGHQSNRGQQSRPSSGQGQQSRPSFGQGQQSQGQQSQGRSNAAAGSSWRF
jgi:histidinol dehydrogenase